MTPRPPLWQIVYAVAVMAGALVALIAVPCFLILMLFVGFIQ